VNRLEEIKTRLEANDTFKHYNKEIGLTFEDFDIIDVAKGQSLQKGKKEIGDYSVLIKADGVMSACYDLS